MTVKDIMISQAKNSKTKQNMRVQKADGRFRKKASLMQQKKVAGYQSYIIKAEREQNGRPRTQRLMSERKVLWRNYLSRSTPEDHEKDKEKRKEVKEAVRKLKVESWRNWQKCEKLQRQLMQSTG